MFKFLIFLIIPFKVFAFVPTDDTALLLAIYGQQVQAVAGIMDMVNKSSETVDTLQKINDKAQDVHHRIEMSQIYARDLLTAHERLKKMKSFVELHDNMRIYYRLGQRKTELTMGHDIWSERNDSKKKVAKSDLQDINEDYSDVQKLYGFGVNLSSHRMADHVSARTAAYNVKQIHDVRRQLVMLNMAQADKSSRELMKLKRDLREDFYTKKFLEVIPENLSFQEYLDATHLNQKEEKARNYQSYKL